MKEQQNLRNLMQHYYKIGNITEALKISEKLKGSAPPKERVVDPDL